jgi:hypothetical protein
MTRWLAVFGLGAIALILFTACGGRPSPQVAPAQNRPTFVWIFSDP